MTFSHSQSTTHTKIGIKTDIPSDIPTLFIRLQKWAFNQGYNYVSKCSINIDIIEDLVSDLEKLNI